MPASSAGSISVRLVKQSGDAASASKILPNDVI
jgi:hypothetical protein